MDPAPVPELHAGRLAALLIGLALAPCASADSPDVLKALNSIRASGCSGRPGVSPPFRESAPLAAAARRSVESATFTEALSASRYRATRSVLVRIGTTGTQSVATLLANEYCPHMLDTAFTEVGVYQRAGETRVVLAAPFTPPTPEAAGAVAVRVLQLVNHARAGARACGSSRFPAATPLTLSDALSRASLAHAAEMAQYSHFSHAGRDGSSPADRMTRAGYEWKAAGENIAAGQTTPEAVVEGWLKSPQHCANLMAPQFREMGIGYYVNRESQAGIYWVQLFGAPR